MATENRKLKNMLVIPELQLKLFGYFAVSGVVFFIGIIFIAFRKLMAVQELMNNSPSMGFEVQLQVNELMNEAVQFTLGGFALYILLTSIFALILSHRIAGPVVAISAFIEELKKSNYDYKRSLRPRDELKQVMGALKELAPMLKDRDKNLE